MTAPPELEPLPARPCAALYIATVAAFLVFCATLALQSRSYGSPDSMTNLQTARCFAAGEGVTSHVVAQVLVPQPDVHRERLRSPGVPILFGLLFRVFAPAPWLPVAFNAVVVLATAALVRRAAGAASTRPAGDLAGALYLIAGSYHLVNVWNIDLLALVTAAFLALGARDETRPLPSSALVLCGAGLAAFGASVKGSYAFGFIAFAALLVLRGRAGRPVRSRRGTVAALASLLILVAALSSPQWLTRVRPDGAGSDPVPTMVLAAKFRVPAADVTTINRTCLWDDPPTLRSIYEQLGPARFVSVGLESCGRTAVALLKLGPILVAAFWAVQGLWTTGARRRVLELGLLASSPLAEGALSHFEPRYMWPLLPVVLVAAASGVVRVADGRRRRTAVLVALLWAAAYGATAARREISVARRDPERPWVEAVAALPSDAVVFAAAPWEVAWYAGRAAVRTPLARRDLVRVARHYQVTHALQLGPRAAREGGELLQALAPDLLSAGPSWALHAIRIVPAGVQPSQSHLAPEGPRRD